MASGTTTASRPLPSWLAKHSSFDYMFAVCRALSQREGARNAARYTSIQPQVQPSRNGNNSKSWSRLRKLKPTFRSSNTPDATGHYSIKHGAELSNRNRNRYIDIIPYDRTRIRVPPPGHQAGNSVEESGHYLNASWVLERYGHKWWIASQAPLLRTAYTFLSIFLQPSISPPETICPSPDSKPKFGRVRTVVQLTQNIESGRRKADEYFPSKVGSSNLILPDTPDENEAQTLGFKVTLNKVTNIEEANCVQSSISITPVTLNTLQPSDSPGEGRRAKIVEDESSVVTFQHMLYTAWPDHGVPTAENRASLLAFIQLVDKTNREIPSSTPPGSDVDPDPPIIVGCSAGIGRTGSFIALSSLLRAFGFLPPANSPTDSSVIPNSPLGPLAKEFNEDMVALEIDSLREQRPRMVEREEQVVCIYEVLASAFETS